MVRYIISDACVLFNKPLVYGGISSFEGQVAVLNYSAAADPVVSYRDLFSQPPLPGSISNCAETGVLGVLPGIISTMQATEVLKAITGMGQSLINQLFTYNALINSTYTFQLSARKETNGEQPKDEEDFKQRDYKTFCSINNEILEEIDSVTFQSMLGEPDLLVIDVREKDELPEVHEFKHLKIPLSELRTQIPPIEMDSVVLFCQSGKCSKIEAELLHSIYGHSRKIYSLKGGLLYWKKYQL
jgi:adenylyltransferase/sulfurtransferase